MYKHILLNIIKENEIKYNIIEKDNKKYQIFFEGDYDINFLFDIWKRKAEPAYIIE